MTDLPVFTTQNGVASLTLREIPYKKNAYIKIQDSRDPFLLLMDCVNFCRNVGAKFIYASGHPVLEQYPLYTEIWRMAAPRECLPATDTTVYPVTPQTLEEWRQLYNARMAGVPNASHMTLLEGREMIKRGDGCFVYRGSSLLGIGMAREDTIHAVVTVRPGVGRDVVLTLNQMLSGDRVYLEVASANTRAIRLYTGLGFEKIEELSKWYKVFDPDKEKYLTNYWM